MPKNKIIYYGTLLLVATVLLWLGAELTRRIVWLLPYTGGVAVAMIVGGFLHELWKRRQASQNSGTTQDKPPDPSLRL